MKSYMKAVRKVVKEYLDVSSIVTYGDKKYVCFGFGIALWNNNLLPRTLQLNIKPSHERLNYSLTQMINNKPLDDCIVSPVVLKQCGSCKRVIITSGMVYYCNDKFISMFENYGDVYYKAYFGDGIKEYPQIYVYDWNDSLVGLFLPLKSEHSILLEFFDNIEPILQEKIKIA